MRRIFVRVAAALALASLLGAGASAQGFKTVEVEGWDLSGLDARVREAVTKASARGAGRRERRAAAATLLERADVLRDAGQPAFYKFALGDYRHVLRYDPRNADARQKADEIVQIYQGLGRPVPENGNAVSGGRHLIEVYAARPKEIDFGRGGLFEDGNSLASKRVAYVYALTARAGQRLSITLEPAGRGAQVFFSLRREGSGGAAPLAPEARRGEYTLPADGKYLLRVYARSDGDGYRLAARLISPSARRPTRRRPAAHGLARARPPRPSGRRA